MTMFSKQVFFLFLGLIGLSMAARAESVFTGTAGNSWNEAQNWEPEGVPGASDDVSIPAGKSVVATGDIACRNLNLAGNLTLGASVVRELDSSARANVSLTAEGDITLSGSAKLTVYAGQLADLSVLAKTVSAGDLQAALYAHANVVSAKGTMTFGVGTTVVPNNDDVSGTPVIFRATDITVAAGATVNATGGGWGWFRQTSPDPATRSTPLVNRHTYALGYGSGYSDGGSYGGKGGGSTTRTYGFSFAPLMPGSPGGIQKGVVNGSRGGGTICLQATQALTVKGTLRSVGYRYEESTSAAGGGIWLCGATVDYSSAEKICADGETSTTAYAAGGGGRISICEGMTTAELADMACGTSRGEVLALSLAQATATGGTSTDSSKVGADGTVVNVVSSDTRAHVTIVTPGVPTLQMEGLTYEERVLTLGATSVDVPEYAYLATDPANERYTFAGHVVSNATTQVSQGGADKRHISFTLESGKGPYVVYLNWTNCERRRGFVSVPSAYGSFLLNGAAAGSSFEIWSETNTVPTSVITFVPASGCTFLGWSGTYPRTHTLGNPATCTSSDLYLLTVRVDGCAEAGESVSWNGGTGRWDDATKWSGGKVPTLLDDVTIASGSVAVSESFAAKSLTLSGGTLSVGATGGTTNVFGTVAGDVTLSGTAVMNIQAMRTLRFDHSSQQTFQSSIYNLANTVRIGGALTVGEGAKVQVANDPLMGLPVIFRVGSLSVASGGTLTADGGGFSWLLKTEDPIFDDAERTGNYNGSSTVYASYGYGSPKSPSYFGAGHAGKCNYTIDSMTYGFENAPLLPGSPSGIYFYYANVVNESYGGGTVCVFADGAVTVDGTISALGVRNQQQGGSSGGAIWLSGTSVTVGDSATVTADGCVCYSGNAGAGGGGRILFTVATTSAMLDQLVDGTATPASLGLTKVAITSERVTVAGGKNTGNSARGGTDGTRYQIYDENATTTMTTTADPVEYIADGFAYGSSAVNYGTTYGVAAPAWGYNTESRTDARFAYAGYVASNATTQVASGLASDPTVSVSFVKPEGPYELRLKWGARQTYHVVTIADTTLGSVTKNGEAYVSGTVYWSPEEATDTLTAVSAAGCEFVCWRGDVPCSVRLNPTITVSAAAATRITAVFRTVTAEAATYHWKSNVTGDWFDPANWDEGNFPWVKDDVVLKSGSCSVDSAFEVRSLTVTNGAALTIEDVRDVIVKGDLLLTSANSSLRIVSAPTDEANTWTNGATRVTVAGTFTVTNSATLYPESDEYTGGSPVFRCGRFYLSDDARVDAVSLGFCGEISDQRVLNLCPGGSGWSSGIGGGYGGLGGTPTSVQQYQAGNCYGLALSPIHPGAPNGAAGNNAGYVRRGGGLVRIHAVRQMVVNGTVDASTHSDGAFGGASGGGIWLTCEKPRSLSFGPSAKLLAKGGQSHYPPNGYSVGGGGRIAVGTCLSEDVCRKMIATDAYPGLVNRHVFNQTVFTNLYPGVTVNVNPGALYDTQVYSGYGDGSQHVGTFRFVDGTRGGLILVVR